MEHKRPTLKDVAAALGVTTTTVSNAYNRPDQLSATMRERVLKAAAELGYAGPDPAARSLRRGRSPVIGVMYTDPLSYAFADPVFVLFLGGLAEVVEDLGVSLTLMPGTPREDPATSPVSAAIVDAFVVFSMPDDDPLVHAALQRGLPMVWVDGPRPVRGSYVGIDDAGGAEAAARHLLELGHTRIGVISTELTGQPHAGPVDLERQAAATQQVTRQRLAGYAAACAAHGLDWAGVAVLESARNAETGGADAARALLTRTPRPTAVLAMSDRLALGAMQAAAELGLRIPRDLSIVGYDDIPAAATADPPLTTVRQSHRDKGRRAGRQVLAALEGRRTRQLGVLPTELVVRESTRRKR